MDRKRSKKVTNEKDIKKHKFSKKNKNCDSSGEDSVDMSEVLYPLTHYLKDREEMIKQVFSVMEKEKLNCMLPPILKEMSKSSLMDTCLKELKNMSDDEVRQVLRGDPYKPSDVKPVPAQQSVDSDSAESNEQNEKKTLLDILEQEMQEIAYNTILRRDENLTVSVEELPDIVAISPNPSPSKEESTVPLICIDSEDEEAAFKSSGMQHHTSRTECIANSQVEIIDVEDSADGSQCPLVSVGMEDKCSHPKSEEVLSKKDVSKCKSTFDSQTKSGTERGEENFLIQIFCDKVSNSERVVTKVCDSGTSILSSRNESTADTGFDDKEYSEKNVQSSTKVSQIQVAVLETEEKRRMSHCNSVSYNKIFQAESNFHSRLDPNYLLFPQVVKPSYNLQCFDPSNKTINGESEHPSKSVEIQEKEEGEISEEDSEEVEVLEAERGKRSPTVFLSSDEDESGMSIRDCKEKKCSKRKHKRRHLESKEHLRNHIEKRGNRSYRRKKSSPATEGLNMSASTEILPEEMNTSSKESFSHSLKEVVSKESSEILKRNLSPRVQSDSTSSVIKVLNADSVVSPADDGVCSETCLLNYMHDDLGNIPLPLEVLDSVCSNSDSLAEDGVCSETVMVDNLNENLENIPCDSSRIDSADEGETVGDSKACSSKSSWADRWAQKKDLKKVVITSKIYRNVRKKIISARKKQGSQDKFLVEAPFLPPVPPLVLHVEGSVQEYEMLQCLVSDVQEEVNKEKSDLSSVSLPVISIADNVRNFTGHLDLSKNTTENQNCLDSQNGTDLQHNVSLDSS